MIITFRLYLKFIITRWCKIGILYYNDTSFISVFFSNTIEDNILHFSRSLIHNVFPIFLLGILLVDNNAFFIKHKAFETTSLIYFWFCKYLDTKYWDVLQRIFFLLKYLRFIVWYFPFSKTLNIMQYISAVSRFWKKQIM